MSIKRTDPGRIIPDRPGRRSHRRAGFTLTEIVVVIGIMGALMGMLLPTLVNVRRQAKLTQCMSQMRQLGLAMQQYDQEHDAQCENYPDMLTYMYAWGYVADPRVFICPMDYTKAALTGTAATLKPGSPSDTKYDWAERLSNGGGQRNCSYLYEFSTRPCDTWWADALVMWDADMPWGLDIAFPEDKAYVDRNGDGVVTWQEAKFVQLENGDVYVTGISSPGDGYIPTVWSSQPWDTIDLTAYPMHGYPRTLMPIVRCFWHCTPSLVDLADNQNRGPEEVLNLALEGNTFMSVPGWEQTAWKYGHTTHE
jgi:prepilin-type N-terminal cleavage/methylation domain-containing protein